MASPNHPQFDEMLPLLEKVQDCFEGADFIKSKGIKYLPPTRSMIQDGYFSGTGNLQCDDGQMRNKGVIDYASYLERAVFPTYVSDAVENYIGLLHKKPPVVKVNNKLKSLLKNLSNYGETVEEFLLRLNKEQLRSGRAGILVDINTETNKPYLALYCGNSIKNWNDTIANSPYKRLNFVALDETGPVFDETTKSWVNQKQKVRVLSLIDNAFCVSVGDDILSATDFTKITCQGISINKIPFYFANSTTNRPEMEVPPLLKIANACLSIYRSEADYRRSLHLQGQDTLVVVGPRASDDDSPIRTGAGAAIIVDQGGDAKYIGVSSSGLAEQRSALEKDHEQASLASGQFVGTNKGNNESGDAMKTRIASRTASLLTIAIVGASALQDALRACGEFLGLSAEDVAEITVTPNLDFVKGAFSAQELIQLVTSRNSGAPLSLNTLHKYLVDYGVTDETLETELELISKEKPGLIKPIIEQIDKSTGTNVGIKDPQDQIPKEAKTNVDSRP